MLVAFLLCCSEYVVNLSLNLLPERLSLCPWELRLEMEVGPIGFVDGAAEGSGLGSAFGLSVSGTKVVAGK